MIESDLSWLDKNNSLSCKLQSMHQTLSKRFPKLDHISVAVYDPKTDYLRTFLDSSPHGPALTHYQARLADTPQLQKIRTTRKPTAIDDLSIYAGNNKEHTIRILQAGYRSSYTIPMIYEDKFYGFVFFNSPQPALFAPAVVSHLDPFARLLAMLVICEMQSIGKLKAATSTIRHITGRRDVETGSHLERMARYSQLIAQELTSDFNLSDEYIENLFLFAPLHDIGKITIPDRILLKPEHLSPDEYELMKTHPVKGLEIVDFMLSEFGLEQLTHINILRNIVLYHHESLDGSGYPTGLAGDDIPLEAKIVTTADIFDALTSKRPYKPAWSNEKAFNTLLAMSNKKLDQHCVYALMAHQQKIAALQAQFQESLN